MRRMNRDDRGATIVLVTVAMSALLLMASFALDVGVFFAHGERAQNSADAQALAVALNCANGLGMNNKLPTLKNGQTVAFDISSCAGKSQVKADVYKPSPFAFTSKSPTAAGHATAEWGALGLQIGTFPLAVGTCSFTGLSLGTPVTLHSYAVPGCPNPSGNFGFVSHGCTNSTVTAGNPLIGTTGNNLGGTDCGGTLDQFLGKDMLVPVWDTNSGTGSQGNYHIISFAQFHVTGWSTNGGSNHGGTLGAMCDGTADGDPFLPATGDKNKPCIRGFFKGFTANTGTVVPGMQCGPSTLLACRVYIIK
jgi:hypothetical protein